MTDTHSLDPAQVLTKLLALPYAEQAGFAINLGHVDSVLSELIDEAGRWVLTDLDKALAATENLSKLSDDLASENTRSHARRAHAQALAYSSRHEESLAIFEESIKLAGKANDPVAAARAQMSMIHVLDRLGRNDESIAVGESARKAFLKAGENEWAAKADANLGVAHRVRNNPEAALTHFKRARDVLGNDPMSAAQIDSNCAEALLDLNEFSKAQDAFSSALKLFEAAGISRAAAVVEGNIADLMSRQGRIDSALYHFEKVRRHFESDTSTIDDGRIARLQAEQAEAFARAGLIIETYEAYSQALPMLDKHGLTWEAARARIGFAKVMHRLGKHAEAQDTLIQAASEFKSLNHTAGYARVRTAQGELEYSRGNIDEALSHFREALPILCDRPAEQAVVHHYLALINSRLNNSLEAEEHLNKAFEVARDYNLAPFLADLHHTRSKIIMASNDNSNALKDLRIAVKQTERLRGSLQAERLRTAFLGDKTTLYEDLVQLLLNSNDNQATIEAFNTIEKVKSRSLLDIVSGAIEVDALIANKDNDPSTTALLKQIAQLTGELNALYSRIEDLAPADRSHDALRNWRQRIEQTERKLQTLEGRISVTRGIGGVFTPPIDLPKVQQLLDPTTALIQYFVANEELIAIVIAKDKAETHLCIATLPLLLEQIELLQFQIERAIGRAVGADADDASLIEDTKRELEVLYGLLIEPIAHSIKGHKKLIIIPHGPLHSVPFNALYSGKQYLIENYEIAYSPSASLLEYLGKPIRSTGESDQQSTVVLGVADSFAPQIEEEAKAVAKQLNSNILLIGAKATSENLKKAATQACIIHLACHARFSSVAPLTSGLKLADSWLTVRDLYQLRLNSPLVVLSGCDTGRSAVDGSDELIGLIRGFVAAGASSLIMSLWMLNDNTSQRMMASLYSLWHNEAIVGCKSLASALKSAQCEMMKTHAHPIYWAPLTLVGLP